MMQGRQQMPRLRIVLAALDADDTLGDGGNKHIDGKTFTDARLQAEARQAGVGQQDGVVLAFVELAQARADIAAQLAQLQVRPQQSHLGLAAQAGAADHGARRQGGQLVVTVGDQRVARVFAAQESRQAQARRQPGRHVLHRMHGDVGTPFQHRRFQFLDEQALAADRGEAAVEQLVAGGGHRHQFDRQRRMGFAQQGLDVVCLPEGQRTLAGGDA